MNLLDLVLLLIILGYLLDWTRRSAAYHSVLIVLSLAGYYVAMVISVYVANTFFDESLHKAIATVVVIATTLAVTMFFGSRLAQKLRLRMMSSDYYKLDRVLALPVKFVGAAALLFVVTQTFAYIPFTQLQFMTQGSTVSITADKFMPDTIYRTTAQSIDPDQFSMLILESDPQPVSTVKLQQSDEFGSLAFDLSESVVRVTGVKSAGMGGAVGSGFAVGDGLFVTAAHVVIELSSVYLKPVGGGAYPATPLVIDESRDIAVLKSNYFSLPPVELYSGRLSEKTPAMALGFPRGTNLTMAEGETYLTSDEELFTSDRTNLDMTNTYYFNGAVTNGNSGGGVFTADKQALGIVSRIDLKGERRTALDRNMAGSSDTILVDSNVVADALAEAEGAYRSQGTGLGRTFRGF